MQNASYIPGALGVSVVENKLLFNVLLKRNPNLDIGLCA